MLQPQDESLPAQPGGCAQCHAGLGAKPNLAPAEADLDNVDCLICHSPDYARTPAADEEGRYRFVPDEGIDILAAAQAAQRPTREMCTRCHLGAAGGPNFKHGDYPTSPEVDVHLADGLHCVDCHTSEGHKIAGGGYMIAHDLPDVEVSCANCHTSAPHLGAPAETLNRHTVRLACQTCHIPAIARDPDHPTQMTRDYTDPIYNEATGLYGPAIGKAVDLIPTYFWWDGHRMATPPKPVGSIDDPEARISPWKPMQVTVPFDAETHTPIYIKQGVYKVKGDLEAAINAGVAASGQVYSGAWEPVTDLMFFDAQHQVAPAAEALLCGDCHSEQGGRLDFLALGYSEAQAQALAQGLPLPSTQEPTPTDEPTPTTEPTATDEPTPTDEPTLTAEPPPTPTDEPTLVPTEEPTPTEEPIPTEEPAPVPQPTKAPEAVQEPVVELWVIGLLAAVGFALVVVAIIALRRG